nr:G protein-coupled receptor [Proales similis]
MVEEGKNLEHLEDLQSPVSVYILIVLGSVIFFASILIIILLLVIFRKNKSLIKNSINIYILNLASIDLIKCLLHLPVFIASIETINNIENSLLANRYLQINLVCTVNSALSTLFEVLQFASFVSIAYERLQMIISPLNNPQKRLLIAKLFLLFNWIVAIFLTILIQVVIAVVSNYRNLSSTEHGCFVDLFHISIHMLELLSGNETLDDRTIYSEFEFQTALFDYSYLAYTLACFSLTIFCYLRIIWFLNRHEKNLFKQNKVESAKENKNAETVDTVVSMPVRRPIVVVDNVEPAKAAEKAGEEKKENQICDIVVDSLPSARVENVTQDTVMHRLVHDAVPSPNSPIDQPKTVELVELNPVSKVIVHTDGGDQTVRRISDLNHANQMNVVGDICVVGPSKQNREKGKRRLEVRTTKKAVTILVSFLACRIFYIAAVILRRSGIFMSEDPTVHQMIWTLSRIEKFFALISFASCFFNSFTFIMVTDFFRADAKKRLQSLWRRMRKVKELIKIRKKVDPQ